MHVPDAELLDEAGDVDLSRADGRAAAAADAELVELLELPHPVEEGGQDRPDAAGVDVAVDVAADQRVDRADVQAGGAADALEDLLELARPWPP